MPVSLGGFGGSTNWPFGPPNDWMTPTDGFPGSPTIAIRSVTTAPVPTSAADELLEAELVEVAATAVVLAVVLAVALDDVLDDLLDDPPPHAVAPNESAASTPTSTLRMTHPFGAPCRGFTRAISSQPSSEPPSGCSATPMDRGCRIGGLLGSLVSSLTESLLSSCLQVARCWRPRRGALTRSAFRRRRDPPTGPRTPEPRRDHRVAGW